MKTSSSTNAMAIASLGHADPLAASIGINTALTIEASEGIASWINASAEQKSDRSLLELLLLLRRRSDGLSFSMSSVMDIGNVLLELRL